jgi:hypothetical protein
MRFHIDHALPNPHHLPVVFVFGSNLAGRHGRGAAEIARERFGARYGVGEGRTGMSYAIPTKDKQLQVLTLPVIESNIREFLDYAQARQDLMFFITRVGCGLAGYLDADIAPIFKPLDNCDYPRQWQQYLIR